VCSKRESTLLSRVLQGVQSKQWGCVTVKTIGSIISTEIQQEEGGIILGPRQLRFGKLCATTGKWLPHLTRCFVSPRLLQADALTLLLKGSLYVSRPASLPSSAIRDHLLLRRFAVRSPLGVPWEVMFGAGGKRVQRALATLANPWSRFISKLYRSLKGGGLQPLRISTTAFHDAFCPRLESVQNESKYILVTL